MCCGAWTVPTGLPSPHDHDQAVVIFVLLLGVAVKDATFEPLFWDNTRPHTTDGADSGGVGAEPPAQ